MSVLWRRIVIFLLSLIPAVFITYKTFANQLGADPAKTIVLFTGEWAIYFLFITLAVTPLRRLINFKGCHFRWLQVHRRMLGLFTLFYAVLHVLAAAHEGGVDLGWGFVFEQRLPPFGEQLAVGAGDLGQGVH